MRALLLQMALASFLPATLAAANLGPLAYYWYTWMNPHRLVWGMLNIQWGKFFAVATLLGWLFSSGKKKIAWNIVTVMIITFYLWTILTTMTAKFPDQAFSELQEW
ncbi:MAG: DUF5935 domain-containing protein, partial [Alphaproteobacteria bacterium]|nr:DUF5935 domain-containing protein [Alphaproteobacteria bacterium]